MKKAVRCSLLSLFAMLFMQQASAQTQNAPQSTAAQQSGRETGSAKEPDLSITANVTARELRFEVVPSPAVEFPGKPERQTVWEAERDNLPRPVQPGVTYRDIGIRLKITSIFPDIDRIVAEALGEVPMTDTLPQDRPEERKPDTQPPVKPPSQPATPSKERP